MLSLFEINILIFLPSNGAKSILVQLISPEIKAVNAISSVGVSLCKATASSIVWQSTTVLAFAICGRCIRICFPGNPTVAMKL